MNDFERHIQAILGGALQSLEMKTLQVNMGLRCNQACRHCHLASSPDRPEMKRALGFFMTFVKNLGTDAVPATRGHAEN